MQTIIKTITAAFNENLELVTLLLISDFGTVILNITLGTIIGTKNDKFNLKKFLFGFVKLLASQCIIFGFCYFLNLISLTIDLVEKYFNMQIFTDEAQTAIIAVIDIIAVLIVRIKDTCLDLIDKIKSMRTLKYTSYDDIVMQQNPEESGGIG